MQNGTLTLVRGDDTTVGVTVTNTDGTIYVLSGCSLVFTARHDTRYASQVILSKTVTGHLAPESGVSTLVFVSGDTININDLPHYFDIKLFTSAPTITTLMNGLLFVIPSATASSCP